MKKNDEQKVDQTQDPDKQVPQREMENADCNDDNDDDYCNELQWNKIRTVLDYIFKNPIIYVWHNVFSTQIG